METVQSSGWRRRFVWRAGLGAFLVVLAALAGLGTAAAQADPPALVYVFRPIGGKYLGKEMDRLADRLRSKGYAVTVSNYTAFGPPAKEAVRLYKTAAVKPRIVALGYSAGGDSAIRFALVLRKSQVPVDLIVALDPTRIANKVPSNVERFVNIFNSEHTMGGGDPKPARDFTGHFAAVDVKDFTDAVHLDISGVVELQNAMFDKIVEVVNNPDVPGPSVPISYTPPKGPVLEIWDSGAPVTAAAGDTVASVAAQFDVPAWLVADVNDIGPDTPLKPGQKLIVPRHIDE